MNTGAIIGRFQVPDLHMGHRNIFEKVLEKHDRLVVLLGVSPLPPNKRDPLSFECRQDVVLREMEIYGKSVSVRAVKDHPSDVVWSERVDEALFVFGPDVTLYGSRDSFIPHYSGTFRVGEFSSTDDSISGSTVRSSVGRKLLPHRDPNFGFAEGVVWATQQQFPTTYTTVDVCLIWNGHIALVRKPGMTTWSLIGGFAEPSSMNDAEDVKREVEEETHLQVDPYSINYIGDLRVEDWRYRKQDRIRTRLYECLLEDGCDVDSIRGGDDVVEAKWFPFDDVLSVLADNHKPLWDMWCQS